jgi:hypothetical protein
MSLRMASMIHRLRGSNHVLLAAAATSVKRLPLLLNGCHWHLRSRCGILWSSSLSRRFRVAPKNVFT